MAKQPGETGATKRVALTDCDFTDGSREREELNGIAQLVVGDCQTEDDVIALAADADALLVQYAPITARVLDALPRCKIISRYGIGVDTIDISAATARGVRVANVPDYCIEEVSDHASALILSSARGVTRLDRTVRQGSWEVALAAPIYACSSMVLGFVGFGRTARRTAEKMKSFNFHILVADPFVSPEAVTGAGFTAVSLDDLIARSDVISLHAPLTTDTYHMMSEPQFKAMKDTAVLINTSRGKLVDEDALYRALEANEVGGAALDVLEIEPIDPEHPLLSCDRVILTPHAAYYSESSREELRRRTLLNVIQVLRGEDPGTILNPL